MTPTEKQDLWNAILKLNNKPYIGSGYGAYNNVKNPALRGGLYTWKYRDMRDLYEQLVKYCELGESEACWRVLQGYKTKIYPAYLRKIYQSLTCGGTPPVVLPIVTTNPITRLYKVTGNNLGFGGGNVTSDGGGTVTERGVCWRTTPNPTIADDTTVDGSGTGTFTSDLLPLTENTTYYVRAYATNSAGTAYGNEEVFTTIADFVMVGSQRWSAKNLTVDTYRNGDPIPFATNDADWINYAATNTGAYRYYNDDPSTEATYGKWYNSHAMQDGRLLAPSGYHIPTVYEYTYLNDYLVSQTEVFGGLKDDTLGLWNAPNATAANLYEYFAVPGGAIDPAFGLGLQSYAMGYYGYYWVYGQDLAYPYYMNFAHDSGLFGFEFDATVVGNGMAVRLIDNSSLVQGQLFGGGILLVNNGPDALVGFTLYDAAINIAITGLDEEWGCSGSLIGAGDTQRGYDNTVTMSNNTCNITAQVLANQIQLIEGYYDWYIPAIDEVLQYIQQVPEFSNLLDTSKQYWTSTELDADKAFTIYYDGTTWQSSSAFKSILLPILGVRKQIL